MFGTNALLKAEGITGDPALHQYWVQEVFPTIQGEGPHTGRAAVFVRMAGCNLRCAFCDTDFESSTWKSTADELISAIVKASGDTIRFAVFTGGEPLRQPIGQVIAALLRYDWEVQIETAGTIWDTTLDPMNLQFCWANGSLSIVCSPKTGVINRRVAELCNNYKYIVRAGDADPTDGLPCHGTQPEMQDKTVKLYRPPPGDAIWVQPMEEYHESQPVITFGQGYTMARRPDKLANKRNTDHAIDLCMRYGYRLSLQTHKMIGLP